MENYENVLNNVIRDKNNNIISANGFKIKDYIVFDSSLGAYSSAMFKIKKYFEINNRAYVDYGVGISPINDFFTKGYRIPTQAEIEDFKR